MISNRTKNTIQATAAVFLVAAFLHITEPVEVYYRILETNLGIYVIGTAIFLLIYPVAGLRWKKMIPEPDKITFIQSMKIIAISYSLNKILPFNSGDIARSKIMESYSEIDSHGEIIGLVALERVMDILVLSTIASLFLLNFFSITNLLWTLTPLIFLTTFLYGLRSHEILFKQFVNHLPSFIPGKIKSFLKENIEGFNSLERNEMLEIITLTGLRWILNIAAFYIILLSSGLSVSIIQVAGLTTVMSLVASLPITPAGLGAVELSATGLLITFGLTSVESGTAVVLLRSLGVLLMGVIGLTILMNDKISFQKLRD